MIAELGEIRIERAVEFDLADPDPILQADELSARFECFELFVRVEDECRPGETSRRTRAIGMEADDEEAGSGEAVRERRILGIARDARIPGVNRFVEIVEATQLTP